jgi:dTDP-4-amino-4,6-dideoxygalactose transaminase
LDEVQAAVLRAKLPRLEGWNARRRFIAAKYSREIANPRVTCPPARAESYVAHLFVVTADNRDGLRKHLEAAGVASDVHYPIPDHLQAPYARGPVGSSLPTTEALANKILTLPCYPELRDDELDCVISTVNGWAG